MLSAFSVINLRRLLFAFKEYNFFKICYGCPHAYMRSHAFGKFWVFEEDFSCLVCKKIFSSISNLYQHAKIHFDEKLYACYRCGKYFRWRSDLQRHLKTHINNGATTFKSHENSQVFSLKNNTSSNSQDIDKVPEESVPLKTVTPENIENMFVYPTCRKIFSTSSNLS